jgi:uncharacterized protein YjbI with pentapeptide repeats
VLSHFALYFPRKGCARGWASAPCWLKLSPTSQYAAHHTDPSPLGLNHQEGKPVIKQDPLYQLLRTEDIKGFNEQRDQLDTSELKNGDYRGRDLRNMNAAGLDFSDSYFRNADLSGIDFRNTNLEGASLLDAKLSGTYFPAALSAEEIRLSLDTGTRLRYRSN